MKLFIIFYAFLSLITLPLKALTFINNSDQNTSIQLSFYGLGGFQNLNQYDDEISISANSVIQKSMEPYLSKASRFIIRVENRKTNSWVFCDRESGKVDDTWTVTFSKEAKCLISSSNNLANIASQAPQNQDQLERLELLGKGQSAEEGVRLYRIKDTNKLVAVKAMNQKDSWDLIKEEVNGLLHVGKSPYAVKPISVLETIVLGQVTPFGQPKIPYVFLVMEPYLGGTLGDVIGKLTGQLWHAYESAFGKDTSNFPSLGDEQAKFYVANLGLILDSIHKLDWAWGDVKPENVLIDKNGYLKAVDFGRAIDLSKTHYAKSKIADDWQQLGERIIKEGFRIKSLNNDYNQHDPAFRDLEWQLRAGKIVSLEELKKHEIFKDFDWDKMKKEEIKSPYIPETIKIPECTECVPYRVNETDKVYISPELIKKLNL